MSEKTFTFYCPTHHIGGEQLLFSRVAKKLLQVGKKVNFVDYDDGFCNNFLKGLSYNKVSYHDSGEAVRIEEDTILIVPISYIFIAKEKLVLTKSSKIVYWCIHPCNVFGLFRMSKLSVLLQPLLTTRLAKSTQPKRFRQVFSELQNAQAEKRAWFMDQSTYDHNRYFIDQNVPPLYFPIPVELKSDDSVVKIEDISQVNFAWFGRISKVDKMNAILSMIDSVRSMLKHSDYKDLKFKFHIIGEGDAKEKIRKIGKDIQTDRLSFVYPGVLFGDELSTYLKCKINIVFAMGTSLLDAANVGIPTILANPSIRRRKPQDNKFSWLYETKNYTLGTYDAECTGHSIEEILAQYLNSGVAIGKKCKEYVQIHDINLVVDKIIMGTANL